MARNDLIVFDMDGVLVDVSGSYRETVRQATASFFSAAPGAQDLPVSLFSLSDLAAVKQSGGLNNDWDLTCLVISLLFSQVKLLAGPNRAVDPWQRFQKTLEQCDVAPLAHFLVQHEHPLSVLFDKAASRKDRFVGSLYEKDVGSGNVIKQIFQEIYLGRALFTKIYGIKPKIYNGNGRIANETLLIDRALLDKLAVQHTLAVATGRPAAEAHYALDRFGIEGSFSLVLTLDDCLRKTAEVYRRSGRRISFCKPSPYMLDIIAQQAGNPRHFFYVGDLPDDIATAKAAQAPYQSIGLLAASPDRETLRNDLAQAGADRIVETFDELAVLFS